MSNKKHDLTRIEDLGEFLHELQQEDDADVITDTDIPAFFESEETTPTEEESPFPSFDEFSETEIFPTQETSIISPIEDETYDPFAIEEDEEVKEEVVTHIFQKEIESYKKPETFDDIKTFAESTSFTGMAVEGNPSFSVLIKEIRFIEDVNDIVLLLKELKLIDSSEEKTRDRLSRGSFLVPRISEFAAIYLAHKLRRFDIDVLVGLSDDIQPPKHQEKPEIGLVSKFNLYQNQSHNFHFNDPKLELSQIIVAATSTLEGYQIVKYISVASEHKLIDANQVEDETSPDVPLHYRELAQRLKAHALKASANAVIGLNYQLTPIPSEFGPASNRYRLTCTGNLVWVNKL